MSDSNLKKPTFTGYYSMIVSSCDDYCTFQVSRIPDVGCPSDLSTFGRSEGAHPNLLARTEYAGTYNYQDKLYLDKDSQVRVLIDQIKNP